MSSVFGSKLKVSIFGQSHSEGIGVVVDGLPAGVEIDIPKLQEFLDRRAPGNSDISTPRKESDVPEFLSGFGPGEKTVTCGAPLSAVIRNEDVRSEDYEDMKNYPRPGHADYTAHVKYDSSEDYRGGGHLSGRLTAALCVAGGISIQVLEQMGIFIKTKILEVGGIKVPETPEREYDMTDIILAAKEDEA